MAQFDIWEFGAKESAGPMVVDVQNAMFDALATRLVVPLYPLKPSDRPILRLNPVVEINGGAYYLVQPEASSHPNSHERSSELASYKLC